MTTRREFLKSIFPSILGLGVALVGLTELKPKVEKSEWHHYAFTFDTSHRQVYLYYDRDNTPDEEEDDDIVPITDINEFTATGWAKGTGWSIGEGCINKL